MIDAVNRADIGVKLKQASRNRTDITIAARRLGCGNGYAAPGSKFDSFGRERFRTRVVIAWGCNKPTELLTLAHEMGHALGLDHVRRGCSTMSHAAYRPCQDRILTSWLIYQRDDILGMRHVWRNRPPKAVIELQGSYTAGNESWFDDASTDGQRNIARTRWEFGDPGSPGNVVTTATPKGFLTPKGLRFQASHVFSRAGLFTVTLTVVDTYGKRSRTSRQVRVAPPEEFVE